MFRQLYKSRKLSTILVINFSEGGLLDRASQQGDLVEGLVNLIDKSPLRKIQTVSHVVGVIYQQKMDCEQELLMVKAAHDKAVSHFHTR